MIRMKSSTTGSTTIASHKSMKVMASDSRELMRAQSQSPKNSIDDERAGQSPSLSSHVLPGVQNHPTTGSSHHYRRDHGSIRQIRKQHPGGKIMIISGVVIFLDIVKEAIKRRAQIEIEFEIEIGEHNGTIKSFYESIAIRTQVQVHLAIPHGKLMYLVRTLEFYALRLLILINKLDLIQTRKIK